MELREKIARAASGGWNDAASGGVDPWQTIADYVLNLPEIRDALAFQESVRSLTKAAMGKGRYEKRGDFMVWIRDDGTESAKLTIYP